MEQIILGIDPGKSGGLALMRTPIFVYSFKNKSEQEIAAVLRSIKNKFDVITYLEKVHAAPGQGVVSMFSFGENYGFLRGCLASNDIPILDVTPQEWQRTLRIPTRNGKTYNEHKKLLRKIAADLYPEVKTNAETADALLIGHYGLMMKHNEPMDI